MQSDGLQRGLDAISNLKLLHDIRHVMLYSSLGTIEASRDLFVGHALRHKPIDLFFARSKVTMAFLDHWFELRALDQQLCREAWCHIGTTLSDGLYRLDHIDSAAAFQNVAPCTCLQRRGDILLVFGDRQHDDLHFWTLADNVGDRFDPSSRQAEIEQNDVRRLYPSDSEGVGCGRALPDHLKALDLLQSLDRTCAKQRMIVDHTDANRRQNWCCIGIGHMILHFGSLVTNFPGAF